MLALVVLSAATAAWGQDDIVRPPRVRDLGAEPTTAPARLASQAELTRLIQERPAVPVTPNDRRRPRATHPALPLEGEPIKSRRARLEAETGSAWMQVRLIDGKPASFRALPCQYLQVMEDVQAKSPGATFVISGEVFTCNDRAYLLTHKVLVEPAPAVQAATAVTAPPPASISASPPTAPVTTAAAPATQPIAGRVDETIDELLGPVRKPVLVDVPQHEPHAASSVAPPMATELPAEDSPVVIDRPVRLVRERGGEWVLACLESDNTLQEPPYRVLPNKLLEEAAKATQELSDDPQKGLSGLTPAPRLPHSPKMKVKDITIPHTLRYLVSGEVKTYRGQRYLLIRKLIPDRDLGQF